MFDSRLDVVRAVAPTLMGVDVHDLYAVYFRSIKQTVDSRSATSLTGSRRFLDATPALAVFKLLKVHGSDFVEAVAQVTAMAGDTNTSPHFRAMSKRSSADISTMGPCSRRSFSGSSVSACR